jgi:hypothetical protein
MPVLESESPPAAPERWGRMPPPLGRLRGLSRITIDRLSRPQELNGFDPPVRSRVVCASGGKRRGVRLIDLNSLDAYIEAQSATSVETWARAPKKTSPPKACRRRPSKPNKP